MREKANKKNNKKKGPIRFEAIIPVFVLWLITFLYFTYYFDRHLKSVIEYVATQANGAEVNVDSVNTSFLRASFDLNRLQVTDKENPQRNLIEISNVHFQYLWDALLRMKFVVEDASINNILLFSPRSSPGKVLPPEPAKPSKLNELQHKVVAQVKNKYGANVLGDALKILESGDYAAQVEEIRGTLKSESRAEVMIEDVREKRQQWDKKINRLSDTSRLKEIEKQVNTISKEKNFLKQAQGAKQLSDLLKEVDNQYKEIQTASKELQSEINAVTQYPKELQSLIDEDIASLKNRFSIPQLDFKDMAMHLFAGDFADHIANARKYQALAKQYMPEKKQDQEPVVPRKRSEGKTYQFPVTTGYPLFWLKRAAISSQGTAESYAGNVSGELRNVTTDPKLIKKPMVLDMNGDFPTAKVMGVKAVLTVDHTKEVAKQSALIQVNSFEAPEKLFVSNENLKFGFQKANGSSTINANMSEGKLNMNWSAALAQPQFLVETNNKSAKEILSNVVNQIPVININGRASGSFDQLKMSLTSNLGEELGAGLRRELGAKLTQAQNKLNALVENRVSTPRKELLSEVDGNKKNLTQLNKLQDLYKKHEKRIQAEINKLKSGGGKDLKEKGREVLKGIKL